MEIRVRAWDEFKQRMFNPNKLLLLDSSHKLDCVIWDPKGMLHSCPLMLYTGLKDTNGIEIYEGDIIKYSGEYKDLITFENGAFWMEESAIILAYQFNPHNAEIIGNIHENPELLEK